MPPADFQSRILPIETLAAGTRLVRLHRSELGPLFFGATGGNRFDDPARAYGVCYLAMTVEGAFAETCLRITGARFVAIGFLATRSVCEIEVNRPIGLVPLHGPGLARVGATAAVASGPHAVAQQWSRAVHDHPSHPDGIIYRSNHDDGEYCIALFERPADGLRALAPQAILQDRTRLAGLLDRYKVGLG